MEEPASAADSAGLGDGVVAAVADGRAGDDGPLQDTACASG